MPGCYSDVAALFQARGLAADPQLYREVQVEYPPVTGLQWWLGMALTSTLGGYVAVITAIGAAAYAVVLAVLRRMAVPPLRQLGWAAAPTLVLAGFVNFDAVPVALLAAGVLAHVRGRDAVSGLLVGLGTAAKLFPGVLVPLVVWARLRQGRTRDAVVHAAVAAAVVVSLNALLALWAPQGWDTWLHLNSDRAVDWDTLWYLALQLGAPPMGHAATNGLIALTVAVGWGLIAWGGRHRPAEELWTLALPLLVWFLLAGKVYSPQFSLWLLPLMILLAVRARLLVAFLAADTAVFLTRFPFLGGLDGFEPSLPYGVFAAAVLARAVVLALILGQLLNPPRTASDGTAAPTRAPGQRSARP